MPIWKSEPLLTRFWRLLFRRGSVLPTKSRRQRRFTVEPLEDRQLLSVSSLAQPEDVLETVCVAPSGVVDVADTTSASLMAALAESSITSDSLNTTNNSGNWLSKDELSDDVGVSYSLGGVSLTLDDDLSPATTTSTTMVAKELRPYGPYIPAELLATLPRYQRKSWGSDTPLPRPHGPMTYQEYLASLSPGGLADSEDDGREPTRCCGPGGGTPTPSQWSVTLGGSSGACGGSSDYVFKTNDPNCHSVSDLYIALQSGNTATLYAGGYVTTCSPPPNNCIQLGVQISGDGAATYFGTTYGNTGTFTWTKPSNVTNANAKRDFTFTYYAYAGSGSSTPNSSTDILLGTLYVHIAWAEVQVQFAGTGSFENKTSQGGQTVNNTVVVGQKVDTKVVKDSVLTITSYQWYASPYDYVKNYETENTHGTVHYHDTNDYKSSGFAFYYTDTTVQSRTGGVSCAVGVSYILNGQTKYATLNVGASYFIESPTVTSYSSIWASWKDSQGNPIPTEKPVGVRAHPAGPGSWLTLGGMPQGQSFSPGIKWTANVVAPPVIGGGEIAYVQLCNGLSYQYINGVVTGVSGYLDGNKYALDTSFTYPTQTLENSVPVGTTLVSEDSPGELLFRDSTHPFDKYMVPFKFFKTYLIYRPEGDENSTIWVTLSVIDWGWYGTAEFDNNKWGLTSGNPFGGGNGTATSVLPEWSANVKNYGWRPI